MCGIIFAANFDKKKDEPANEWVLDQFEDQSSRGTEGFGAVLIQNDGSYITKRSCNPTKMIIDVYDKDNKAPIVLLHHRWPTSSENKMKETHPIEVDNGSLKYKYLVTHNGVISNEDEMKKQHEELGFIYSTQRTNGFNQEEFNDSEVFAIEFARLAEDQIKEIASKGSIAFVALQIDKKLDKVIKVFFGRNDGAPLKMSKTRDKIRLSSEGEGNDIKAFTYYSFNLTDFKLHKKDLKIKEEKWQDYAGMRSQPSPTAALPIQLEMNNPKNEKILTIDLTNPEEVIDAIDEFTDDAEANIDAIYDEELEKISEALEVVKNDILADKVNWDKDKAVENVNKTIESLINKIKLIKEEADKNIETIKSAVRNRNIPDKNKPQTLSLPKPNYDSPNSPPNNFLDEDDDFFPTHPYEGGIHAQPLEETQVLNERSNRGLGFGYNYDHPY